MAPSRERAQARQFGTQGGASLLESALGFRMGRAHRHLREGWEQTIADLGLSAPQAAMLRTICERPGLGLRELARAVRTDPMNAKRLADHLEQRDLVRSSDRSSLHQRRDFVPTDEGLALGVQVAERARAWEQHLSELLGAGELEELKGLLAHLEDVLAVEARCVEPQGEGGERTR